MTRPGAASPTRGVKLGGAGRSLRGLQVEASWLPLTEVQRDAPLVLSRPPLSSVGGILERARAALAGTCVRGTGVERQVG